MPRLSGSLMRSRSPWSMSSFSVCSVSSADFLPCSSSTCSAVISCVEVRTVVVAPHWIRSSVTGSQVICRVTPDKTT